MVGLQNSAQDLKTPLKNGPKCQVITDLEYYHLKD